MYQPPHFREDDRAPQHALIRTHPLGLLISAGAGGLMANPLPFLLDADGDGPGTLRAHLARANAQWRDLDGLAECLVVFQGPQAYVTPSWYATKRETGKVVPTWNYATVQAWGRPRLVEDPAWLRRQIDDLTRAQEAGRAAPWSVADAPPAFTAAQLRGIVGIEIALTRLAGKWKVSQNRPEADRAGVVAGLTREAGADDPMARLVAARGGRAAGTAS
ncbi:FMN-binding negative transcriptional regulator [Methylobacterium planeticum]|uniref:FMN-binding negative transcriptional regulator n=1 Tax=Methylobacterium planeticum TaxID=2615211 RepID=A0A6N6MV48_9HYPH|nr:FMN-binding negative transcriptional regulator [Methylobacterium planeticum]KAB1074363.1 FMN-binding negative transcriptional regulator [Methylobacterium planeticum]